MDILLLINYVIAFISIFSVCFFVLVFLKHRDRYMERPQWDGRTPSVSVIIPAYNEGKYLGSCLKSVLSADYPADKLEIIVVDDGSTDDTAEVARSFAGNGVKVFTKKNGGKGAALNFGLERSGGELVATMDADSYITANTLKELIPYFKDGEVMAVTPAIKIRPSGSPLKEFQRVEYLLILFSRKLLSFIDSVPVTPGPFSIFRKSVFEKVGSFSENNLVEDQEIALRIQSHNYKIRSSLTAEVYTEPPDNMRDLLRQRVRWQRGGIRNYWAYRSLIRPEYGDFGMFFVPMNFVALASFFTTFFLLIYTILSTPYYFQYVWIEALGMGVDPLIFTAALVFVTTTFFLYLAVRSFKGERVNHIYMLAFLIFYWYLMLGYNLLFLFKELRRESYSW